MNKKIKLFFKTIEIKSNEKLAHTISLFVKEEKHLLLYKNGQIFFIQDRMILSSKEVETQSALIIKFDGIKMQRIERGYYLGSSVASVQQYDYGSGAIDLNIIDFEHYQDASGDGGGSSNNNNNNNNNNGNNGNNG